MPLMEKLESFPAYRSQDTLINYQSQVSKLNARLERGKFPSLYLSNERVVVGERGTW